MKSQTNGKQTNNLYIIFAHDLLLHIMDIRHYLITNQLFLCMNKKIMYVVQVTLV
jgi:hypothetical protein